jgi:hypothetical protein
VLTLPTAAVTVKLPAMLLAVSVEAVAPPARGSELQKWDNRCMLRATVNCKCGFVHIFDDPQYEGVAPNRILKYRCPTTGEKVIETEGSRFTVKFNELLVKGRPRT